MTDKLVPGDHPHQDQPNWTPEEQEELDRIQAEADAQTEALVAYVEECRRDGKRPTDTELAKLLGHSRKEVRDMRELSNLPKEFLDLCFKTDLVHSRGMITQLARLSRYLATGKISHLVERECCPHCGGTLRARHRVPREMLELWDALVDYEEKSSL